MSQSAVKFGKVAISSTNIVLQFSLLLDAQDKFGVFVLSDRMLDLGDSHACDIDIPAINIVALRQSMHDTSVDSIAVNNLNL